MRRSRCIGASLAAFFGVVGLAHAQYSPIAPSAMPVGPQIVPHASVVQAQAPAAATPAPAGTPSPIVGDQPDTRGAEGIGRLVAQLHTMRRMSVSVAGMLQAGKEPVVEASIVKDIGTVWEQQLPHRVRELAAFVEEDAGNRETLEQQLAFAIKTAPKLTIQGGTTEVLRGIIARGLGLR